MLANQTFDIVGGGLMIVLVGLYYLNKRYQNYIINKQEKNRK